MHNIIFPSKDTTIYSKFPDINTGLDEILEITKEISSSNYFYRGTWQSGVYYKRFNYVLGGSGEYFYSVAENISQVTSSDYWVRFDPSTSNENSRILIQFDLSLLNSEALTSASVAYLNLYTAIAKKIASEYTLNAYAVDVPWEMGTGNFLDKATQEGATWNKSSSAEDWNSVGGTWYATPSGSQIFNFSSADVRMDITDIFNGWNSSSVDNNGLIITRPEEQEQNSTGYGSLSFYSLDTHTVYLPSLEILYDDHIYDTSSFVSQSISSSISQSLVNVDSVDVSTTTVYYMTASINETLIDVLSTGYYYSASISYSMESINLTDTIQSSNGSMFSSSSVFYYSSASITSSYNYLLPGDNYYSSSAVYTSASLSETYTIFTSETIVSQSVINTYVTNGFLTSSFSVYIKNLASEYKYDSTSRFNFIVKPAYQAKTFYETATPLETYYVSDDLYYSIRDAYTNRIIIPFSDYTKVSIDSTGYYFDLCLSGFMPERFYKIIFKYISDGNEQYFDTNSQFKVVK